MLNHKLRHYLHQVNVRLLTAVKLERMSILEHCNDNQDIVCDPVTQYDITSYIYIRTMYVKIAENFFSTKQLNFNLENFSLTFYFFHF